MTLSLGGETFRLGLEDAADLAAKHFGITGSVTLLSGERDENFLIRSGETAFVLKVTHPDENRGAIRFQTRALLHVAKADPPLPTPRLLPARDGYEIEVKDRSGRARTARLLSFLDGAMAAQKPVSSDLRRNIGRVLARLDKALSDFCDPADSFELYWDIERAPARRPMLSAVSLAVDRANVEHALDRFDAVVSPASAHLRRQVIHNDLTPFNLLVSGAGDSNVTGVIDFGDMIRAPLINDLAIACAYHIAGGADPLAPVLEIVAAYHAVNPILVDECDLIVDLMRTRLAITVLITEWRAARQPENRTYILKNHPTATAGLVQLSKVMDHEARHRLRHACGLEV